MSQAINAQRTALRFCLQEKQIHIDNTAQNPTFADPPFLIPHINRFPATRPPPSPTIGNPCYLG